MALFDLLSPVLSTIDNVLDPFTSSFIRISLWALLSAFITSVVFKKLSNPKKITALKIRLKSMQNELNQHDGEFSELKSLAVDTIKLSVKRMGMTFLPAMFASIPIVFVLTYLSNHYEFITPMTNDVIPISVAWENNKHDNKILQFQDDKLINDDNSVQFIWFDSPSKLVDANNQTQVLTLPIPLSGIIHKKQWWNALIGNPAGYLADDSVVNIIQFDFKQQSIISFGPSWMHGWLFVFFFMTFVFSIGFLFLFKIKF